MIAEATERALQIEGLIGDALLRDALRLAQDFVRDFAPALRQEAVRLRQRYDAVVRLGLNDAAERIETDGLREQVLNLVYDSLRLVPKQAPAVTRDATDPVVRCSSIGKRFSRTAFALKDVSLELRAGEVLGIVGPNGAGKTTLLRILIGALAADAGEIAYPAISDRLDWRRIKGQIAYVPQAPERWYGTVRANLNFAAAVYRLKDDDLDARIAWVLSRYDLNAFEHCSWSQLSGGYRTRHELARAMLTRPRLLVLDEPLALLDVLARRRFLEDVRSIARAHDAPTAVIVTSQHLHDIESVADSMMVIKSGAGEFSGSLADLEARTADRVVEVITRVQRGDVEIVLAAFGLRHVEASIEGFIVSMPRAADVAEMFTALRIAFGGDFTGLRDVSRSSRHLLMDSR